MNEKVQRAFELINGATAALQLTRPQHAEIQGALMIIEKELVERADNPSAELDKPDIV